MELQEYDKDTGRIICSYAVTEAIAEIMRGEGRALIESDLSDSKRYYVDITKTPHEITLRPAQRTTQNVSQIAADGDDTLILDNLPVPCNVSIGGETYTVNDGRLEWSTLGKGHYPIWVSAFPHADWRGEVEAV